MVEMKKIKWENKKEGTQHWKAFRGDGDARVCMTQELRISTNARIRRKLENW